MLMNEPEYRSNLQSQNPVFLCSEHYAKEVVKGKNESGEERLIGEGG